MHERRHERLYVAVGMALSGVVLVGVLMAVTGTTTDAPERVQAPTPDVEEHSEAEGSVERQRAFADQGSDAPAGDPSSRLQTPPAPTPITSTSDASIRDDVPSGYKVATATVFWVGEDATSDNSFIHNRASAWDEAWEESFGGYDDPNDRCGYEPCGFRPLQSPFYVALPYNDLDNDGMQKQNAVNIPWYVHDVPVYTSLLEGVWVEVATDETRCYGWWADVGPYEQDDFEYVFGDAPTSKNTVGLAAGIDLSPALADCLSIDGAGVVRWRFVGAEGVPDGPWMGY